MSNIDFTIENVVHLLKEEYAERYLKEDDHLKVGKVSEYVSSIVAEFPERKEMVFQFHHDKTITYEGGIYDTIPIEHLKIFIHDKEKVSGKKDEIVHGDPQQIFAEDYVGSKRKYNLMNYLSEHPKWKENAEQLVLKILKRKEERIKA